MKHHHALAALTLVACSTLALAQASEAKSDVAISWERGVAYVPGKFFPTTPAEIKTDKPYPVVLYLHGCGGIGATDKAWGPFLKDLGFIVVQPDSLRRERPISCDGAARKGGLFPGVYKLRLEEVGYAREQISNSPWADKNNVFLMGHSEGGITVSQVRRSDFRGTVISAWHCGTTGIRTPAEMPVLAIDHQTDPWFPGVQGGGCAKHFGSRSPATMVTLAGHSHDTFEQPAKEALAAFLKELSARP